MPRPLSPPYVRGTVTNEAGSQVRENELFHFESEVVPVLEMLVGRVIEKSLLEVQVFQPSLINFKISLFVLQVSTINSFSIHIFILPYFIFAVSDISISGRGRARSDERTEARLRGTAQR